MHWRFLISFEGQHESNLWSIDSKVVPEYDQNPVAHRKSPTAIKMSGRVTHCETLPFAGSKKATKGNAGLRVLVSSS